MLAARFPIAGAIFLGACCASAWADGGRLVLVERQGSNQVFVFASPDQLRAGPIDISVLIQNAETGAPVDHAQIAVSLTPHDRSAPVKRAAATKSAATNKLFYAALLELPEPGRWDAEIAYELPDGSADQLRFRLDVGEPLPRWLTVWPWFGWPAGVVLLFGLHRWLVWRRQPRPPRGRSDQVTTREMSHRATGRADYLPNS